MCIFTSVSFSGHLGMWMGVIDLSLGTCLDGTSGQSQGFVLFCFKPLLSEWLSVAFLQEGVCLLCTRFGSLEWGRSTENFGSHERSGQQSCEFNRLHTNTCQAKDPIHYLSISIQSPVLLRCHLIWLKPQQPNHFYCKLYNFLFLFPFLFIPFGRFPWIIQLQAVLEKLQFNQ